MNKILVEVTIPLLDISYDIFMPVGKSVYKVIQNIKQGLNDLYESNINIQGIFLDSNGNIIDINSYVKNTNLKNGTKVVLL